jgi:hypothetical protein
VHKLDREVIDPAVLKAIQEKQVTSTQVAYAELELVLKFILLGCEGNWENAEKYFRGEIKDMLSKHCKV